MARITVLLCLLAFLLFTYVTGDHIIRDTPDASAHLDLVPVGKLGPIPGTAPRPQGPPEPAPVPAPEPAPEQPAGPEPPTGPAAPAPPAPPTVPKPPSPPGTGARPPTQPGVRPRPGPVLESGLGLTLGVEIFSDGTIQQAKDFDYGLGSYDEDGEVTPFSDSEGEMGNFYDKVRDLFVNIDPVLSAQLSDQQPNDGPSGNPDRPDGKRMTFTQALTQGDQDIVTATSYFDPAQPSDVCFAWSSLDRYCGSAGSSCLCYSSTYYVPDVWNRLASGCASMTTECSSNDDQAATWCSVGQQAYSSMTWCAAAPSDDTLTSVGFAHMTGTGQAAATTTPTPAQQATDNGPSVTSAVETTTSSTTTPTTTTSPTAPTVTDNPPTSDGPTTGSQSGSSSTTTGTSDAWRSAVGFSTPLLLLATAILSHTVFPL